MSQVKLWKLIYGYIHRSTDRSSCIGPEPKNFEILRSSELGSDQERRNSRNPRRTRTRTTQISDDQDRLGPEPNINENPGKAQNRTHYGKRVNYGPWIADFTTIKVGRMRIQILGMNPEKNPDLVILAVQSKNFRLVLELVELGQS